MKREESMCPIFTAAYIMANDKRYVSTTCDPARCMWAVPHRALMDDGKWHVDGYRCGHIIGAENFIDKEDA